MADILAWLKTNWQLTYLAYSLTACVTLVLVIDKFGKNAGGAQLAAKIWGSIGFALLMFYLLGAATDTSQFLTLFAFGALGTALGYLTGVWLAPSSLSEENRFAKAQNVIATVFAGAVGTKLLSFWDDLTKGDPKPIFQPAYYLPILCGLVGYFIALAAFYTLRTFQNGQVRITAPAGQFVEWLDTNQHSHGNGIAAGKQVQFSGASDFDDDLSVNFSVKQQKKQTVSVEPPHEFITATGLLTAPPEDWIIANPAALDWTVIATSNRDRSKCANYDVHFVAPVTAAP